MNREHPGRPFLATRLGPWLSRGSALAAAILCWGCGEKSTTPPSTACGEQGTICTVMGDGRLAWAGEGAPPDRVSLYWPTDLVFDGAGRLVVLDWNNQRVRRLDGDGKVRTIVGTGAEDTVRVQGTPALETSLHHCYSMAYDAGGTLYLSGFHVPWVLRVTPEMLVWVYAGKEYSGYSGDEGPALEAAIGVPTGLAVARSGAPLIVTDSQFHCLRSVDADGIIHTLAGTGSSGYSGDGGPATSAMLKAPYRVDYDNATGAVYVCDTGNHAVRRIDPTGIIVTVAGTGQQGYDGDGGPAVLARLNTPMDAQIGPDGALYIADANNHRVRRIDAAGVIQTIAGSGTPGYSGDGGPAAEAKLNGPSALAFDAAGNLYVADTYNSVIRKIVLVAP